MKSTFIIGVIFSAFMALTPNVKAANFTDNQTVDANKTWTIKFTSDVGFDDATKQGITVIDSKGNTVNVGIKLGQDNRTIMVTAPEGGYTVGQSYILDVGTKTHSSKDDVLKSEYKLHFNIKSDNSEDTTKPSVISVYTLDNDTIRVKFNKDVDVAYATNISNYKIQNSSGINITTDSKSGIENITVPGNSKTTASIFDINMKSNLVNSQYALTIKDIQDTASPPNVMDDYSAIFDGSNDGQTNRVYAVPGDNYRKVTLVFDEEMDSSSLCDTSNYLYVNGNGDTKILPNSSQITVSADSKSVTIELPDSYTYYDTAGNYNTNITSKDNQIVKLYATGVKDANGNELEVGNYGGTITPASSGATVKVNSFKIYYDGDDLKADIVFTEPIDSDTLNPSDFTLAGQQPDSVTSNGSKVTLTFDSSNNDKSDASTKINIVKAAGESAQLIIKADPVTKDVTGVQVSTGGIMTPYYYDAAPRTIVSKTNGYATNWTAVANASAPEIDVQFDTPLEPSSINLTSDFAFSVNGASLSPSIATVNGKTAKFKFNPTDKVGNKTIADYFVPGSTITVTPKTTTMISTLKDKNDDYAYYTPSNDDNKGIKILITAATGNGQ